MEGGGMQNFNFDEWSALAQSAPEEFESRRSSAIENVISGCTNVRRLRGLQCRIDLERERARTPLKACVRLSSMMWDSLYECREQLHRLAYAREERAPLPPPPKREAKILAFPSRPR
jgi:hypothetical protein